MSEIIENAWRRAAAIGLVAVLLAACAEGDPFFAAVEPPKAAAPQPKPPAALLTAARFAAAASHPLAAETAREVLRKGGTAVDATIAAALVMGVVEPQSSGLGGGGFLLHYDAAKKALAALDGRETAPAAALTEMFLENGKPMPFATAARGGKSVGVPGLVRLMEDAHKAHGKLPWKDLFGPAIGHAETGFEVSARLHQAIAEAANDLKASREAAALYLDDKGAARPKGYLLKNPALAATLRAVAERGAEAFYAGATAEAITRAVRETRHNPAQLTEADLALYRAKTREPVCLAYRAHKVCSMPPPSSGGLALLQILGTLGPFDLKAEKPFSADAVHLISEASRLAFADREVYVGDPDSVPVPVRGLLAPDYLAERAKGISRTRAMKSPAPGMPAMSALPAAEHALDLSALPEEGESTAHISVVDAAGNVAALTASIERGFGARVTAGGFVLNNQLTDFAFQPTRQGGQVANAAAPHKRPRSSMAPTIVFDGQGRPVLALGSPGGPRIIGYVAKTVIATLDWGMEPAAAVRAANVLDRGRGIEIEKGSSLESLKAALEAKGHGVALAEMDSGVNLIAIQYGAGTTRTLTGAADPRREGMAAGE